MVGATELEDGAAEVVGAAELEDEAELVGAADEHGGRTMVVPANVVPG